MQEEMYYIQRLARQSMTQLVPIPDGLQIPKKYLRWVDCDEFIDAFHTYQEMLRQIYTDIYENPESFDMVCLPIEVNKASYDDCLLGPVTISENKSRKSFFKLPNLMLALASVGEVTMDGGLKVNVERFKNYKNEKSSVKITKPEYILKRMCDYGFEIPDLAESFTLKSREEFILYYPDNSNLLLVLKAFEVTGFYERFLSADYRYILHEGDSFEFELEDILRICGSDMKRNMIRAIYEKLTGIGCTTLIEYYGFFGKLKFYQKKPKKEILAVNIERNHETRIDVRLRNIGEYSDRIHGLSDNIEKQLVSGRDCVQCGCCKEGSIGFNYQGTSYQKCIVICCGFSFRYFNEDDISSVVKLLDLEYVR